MINNKRTMFIAIIPVIILIAIFISLLIYTSPSTYVKVQTIAFINQNILTENTDTLNKTTKKVIESIHLEGINISKMSDNEGGGYIYYFVCMINNTQAGIFMRNYGTIFMPDYKVTSIKFY